MLDLFQVKHIHVIIKHMPKLKKATGISKETPAPEKKKDVRGELLNLLKVKMPGCFDREPQGMNSGVEKLADSILELLK